MTRPQRRMRVTLPLVNAEALVRRAYGQPCSPVQLARAASAVRRIAATLARIQLVGRIDRTPKEAP